MFDTQTIFVCSGACLEAYPKVLAKNRLTSGINISWYTQLLRPLSKLEAGDPLLKPDKGSVCSLSAFDVGSLLWKWGDAGLFLEGEDVSSRLLWHLQQWTPHFLSSSTSLIVLSYWRNRCHQVCASNHAILKRRPGSTRRSRMRGCRLKPRSLLWVHELGGNVSKCNPVLKLLLLSFQVVLLQARWLVI